MTQPLVLASAVREVQVFRSGALVARLAALPAGAIGPVQLEGLPLCLVDESLRASVLADDTGGRELPRPGDLRAELVLPPLGALLSPPAPEEVQALERRLTELQARLAELSGEVEVLDRLALALPEWDGEAAPRAVPVGPWLEALEWQRRAFEARAGERTALEQELRVAQEELARLRRREQDARARRDARAEAVSKRVALELRGEPLPVPATLRVEYRVPGAWWVPRYVLRLARDGKSALLALRAHVTQDTGEPWERVRLWASTADLLRETELPELTSLRIGRRQPPVAKRAWREPPPPDDVLVEGMDKAFELLRQRRRTATGAMRAIPANPFVAGADPFAPPADAVFGAASIPEGAGAPAMKSIPAPAEATAERRPATGAMMMRMPAPGAAAPPPPPPPRPVSAPMPTKAMRSAPVRAAKGGGWFGGGGGAPADDDEHMLTRTGAVMAEPMPEAAPPPPSLEPMADLLRYGSLGLDRWDRDRADAGKLRPLRLEDQLADLEQAERAAVLARLTLARRQAEGVLAVALPPGTERVERSSGHYDHRYDAEGPVDVPSDGELHDVPLLAHEAPVKTRLVAVPRESDLAVRVAKLRNPLEAPLLAGPAEVYLGDEFLVSTPLRTVPTAGELEIGLGIEPGLKVARNTFYEEVSTGLLGGGLSLQHRIEVTVASRLAAPVEVEVRELVPIKGHDDEAVSVSEEGVAPPWEKLTTQEDGSELEGGRRWRLTLAPGEERKLVAGFKLEIDAKQELRGGNRRA